MTSIRWTPRAMADVRDIRTFITKSISSPCTMLPASCVSKREQEWEGLGTATFQGLILKSSQSLPAEERTILIPDRSVPRLLGQSPARGRGATAH